MVGSLVDDVHLRLKAWVMDEVRTPGVRVNVDAVARELAVSPTPVREALTRLETEGVVVKDPPRGWFVTPLLDAAGLHDLFELRNLLEPWAAGRAADGRSAADLARLREELGRMPSAPEGPHYDSYRDMVDHDRRFHDLLLELAGNSEVRRAFDRTNCHLHLFRLTYGQGMGTDAIAEHRAIAAAVEAGDATAARAAMRRHLRLSQARLRDAVSTPAPMSA